MSDVDKILRKALLKTSDVIHDPGAAIDQITRLTERVAALKAENRLARIRLVEAGKRADKLQAEKEQLKQQHHAYVLEMASTERGLRESNSRWEQALIKENKRADKLQARLDAVRGLQRYAVEAEGYQGWKIVPAEGYESRVFVDTDDLEAVLKGDKNGS
jgi:FtsZ-binding cell division protein ZapB